MAASKCRGTLPSVPVKAASLPPVALFYGHNLYTTIILCSRPPPPRLTRLPSLLHSGNRMRFLFATLVGLTLIGFGFQAEAELVNGIDAIVHDSIITFQDVRDKTSLVADKLRLTYADQPDVLEKKISDAAKENLQSLIESRVILHEFETAGYSLPESIIDEQLDEYIKAKYGDRVTMTKSLQQEGITFEQFRRNYKESVIVGQMRYQNIAKQIIISPHKVETYYLQHKDDYKEDEKVKLRRIVLNKTPDGDNTQTRKLADEILGKLKDGASFNDMAAIYSQSSQGKQDADWVEKSTLRPELADAISALKPGDKSGVIETPGAFFILSVEDKNTARFKPLPEVRDEVEKILQEKERARLQQQWIERLKNKTFIREFTF
jgi:peptidyl-prolyl cis-trans isomerase SurA